MVYEEDNARFYNIFSLVKRRQVDEFSILYGKRTLTGGQSISCSGGISVNNLVYKNPEENSVFVGVPFELNINGSKIKRSVLGLIMVSYQLENRPHLAEVLVLNYTET